jgi:hypothetical protein
LFDPVGGGAAVNAAVFRIYYSVSGLKNAATGLQVDLGLITVVPRSDVPRLTVSCGITSMPTPGGKTIGILSVAAHDAE